MPGSDARDLKEMLERIKLEVNEGYTELFYDRLPGIAQRLANDPNDLEAFAEGVTIYHIVVEATLALTGQRFESWSL